MNSELPDAQGDFRKGNELAAALERLEFDHPPDSPTLFDWLLLSPSRMKSTFHTSALRKSYPVFSLTVLLVVFTISGVPIHAHEHIVGDVLVNHIVFA